MPDNLVTEDIDSLEIGILWAPWLFSPLLSLFYFKWLIVLQGLMVGGGTLIALLFYALFVVNTLLTADLTFEALPLDACELDVPRSVHPEDLRSA